MAQEKKVVKRVAKGKANVKSAAMGKKVVKAVAKGKTIAKTVAKVKKERNDYKGPLQPEIDLSEFSKEFLLKIMRCWGELWEAHNSALVRIGAEMEGVGPLVAGDLVARSIEEVAPSVFRKIAEEICKVDINTVEGRIKAGRFIPDNLSDHYTGARYKILSNTEATLTYDHCWVVDSGSVGNDINILRYVCDVVEPRLAMAYMNYPGERKVAIKMLKVPEVLPPKPDEPICIFSFKLEEKE